MPASKKELFELCESYCDSLIPHIGIHEISDDEYKVYTSWGHCYSIKKIHIEGSEESSYELFRDYEGFKSISVAHAIHLIKLKV